VFSGRGGAGRLRWGRPPRPFLLPVASDACCVMP